MKNFGVIILLIMSVNSSWALESAAAKTQQLAGLNEGQVPMVPPPYQMATLPQQSAADQQLTAKVQKALKAKLGNYNPEKNMIVSQNGSVILQGKVTSPEEAQQIVQVVSKINGVNKVHNKMMVLGTSQNN